ncbi:molybdenum cofactor biosynthesis protein MoeA [Actinoplanes sp. SE50]|uniref:molybdopterin molybdotransferase MoeA n=1 Tax=unclassified Actinoplanes TaxID=2626549 RepID=UPI00023EDDAC|nr:MULTISPECIES: molybdopterin molybdotransferase MoeA [unclassified Actinoplanes]AEV89207.1 Molybdopterin biosynthesis protein moeA [Actinoplanes sp. SE50/110]ATO87615.1 molybdenum cofactor biosynthesis protein MoeA [Actinoplanes sp. SE50]SLM05033.1 molybdopterin molybdenumtransferase MoeA [Actinoplanes sp. SE50/110]
MSTPAIGWDRARELAHQAGLTAATGVERIPLADGDGRTLAEPLRALTALPAFATSSIDGWAVRGDGPWRRAGQVLAGGTPPPLTEDGTCVEIATGAMVPAGAAALIRVEESEIGADGTVTGTPRPSPEWRLPGEEAALGEELLPAGTPVDPAVIGVAATCGHELLAVRRQPRAALLVFGDELLTSGRPGDGRVRDSLGPQVPSWLRRCGATVTSVSGPVKDTLDAHVEAVRAALDTADLICTTGGTMHGPVDHLHPALTELGAEYVVNTVGVRPGFPMLLARIPGPDGRPRFLAGLPGNPQSAVIALISLVAPLLTGLAGRPFRADLPLVTAARPIPGRGRDTHLALATLDHTGRIATPAGHVGSAMLRGLATAHGFAVIRPGVRVEAGDDVPFLPLPLLPGERP